MLIYVKLVKFVANKEDSITRMGIYRIELISALLRGSLCVLGKIRWEGAKTWELQTGNFVWNMGYATPVIWLAPKGWDLRVCLNETLRTTSRALLAAELIFFLPNRTKVLINECSIYTWYSRGLSKSLLRLRVYQACAGYTTWLGSLLHLSQIALQGQNFNEEAHYFSRV